MGSFLQNRSEDLLSGPVPAVPVGRIERIPHFPSKFIAPRHIGVWLPPMYQADGSYAVLYMHDGQMLFDPAITWNGQAWGVAEIVTNLIRQQKIEPCIVVGIWHNGRSRAGDYFPQKVFHSLPPEHQQYLLYQAKREDGTPALPTPVQSDNYLKFIVQELKPLIDNNYAVRTDRAKTVLAGSSMGGLISAYAICEYPDIFGGAACLSTHWIGLANEPDNPIPEAIFTYLQEHLPDPATHKIYFDFGDQTLDAFYEPQQKKADTVMKQRGYDAANWQTRKFAGADHSENAWQARFHIPLKFLLGLEPAPS